MTKREMVKGAAKNVLSRFYPENSEQVKARRDICNSCVYNGVIALPILGLKNGCNICKCTFPEKWKMPNEKCPINKW